MKQKTMHVEPDPRDGSDAEAVSASSTNSLNFFWKESLAKKLSIKNVLEVNPKTFFDLHSKSLRDLDIE